MAALRLAAACCLMALLASAANAQTTRAADSPTGAVVTADKRISGKIAIKDGKLQVGQQTLEWSDVLMLTVNRKIEASQAVRLSDGQLLACRVLSMKNGSCSVHSFLLGKHSLDVKQLAAIEFQSDLSWSPTGDAGVLQRWEAEPVPGTVQWIDDRHLAIDSPLGTLTLDRNGLRKYVFDLPRKAAASAPATAPADEIVLSDGSLLRAEVSLAGTDLQVRHAALGQAKLPATVVAGFVRKGKVALLDDLQPKFEAKPLLGKGDKAENRPAAGLQFVAGPDGNLLFQRAVVVEPQGKLVYALDKLAGARAGSELRLIAHLRMSDESKAGVRVIIRADEKVVFDKEIQPAGGEDVAVGLGRARQLSVEVEFGKVMKFPCRLVIGEGLLVPAAE